MVNDDYWNVDLAFTALRYNIPKDMLFEWFSMNLEAAMLEQTCINLKNFYFVKIHAND